LVDSMFEPGIHYVADCWSWLRNRTCFPGL
jgi:hypothetical protein